MIPKEIESNSPLLFPRAPPFSLPPKVSSRWTNSWKKENQNTAIVVVNILKCDVNTDQLKSLAIRMSYMQALQRKYNRSR